MLRSVEVKDYMLHNPIKLKPEDDVFEAIDKILAHKVSGVCVIDEHENLLGVLSEMDCLKAVLSAVYNQSYHVGHVEEFMTPIEKVVTTALHDNVVDLASDMLKHSHRRRPVVEEGKLVGQVTCRQLLQAVKDFAGPEGLTGN